MRGAGVVTTRRWALPVTAALSTSLLMSCGLARPPEPTLARSDEATVLVMDDPRITESSGLAASVVHPGIFYTHNDKGAGPEVYAVAEDGSVQAVIELEGAPSEDWEDITVTPDGQVWVADIGGVDEQGRSQVSLVSFREPAELADGQARWVSFRLGYEDGAHDAEALLLDPQDRRKYVITKDSPVGGIYAAPEKLRRGEVNTLKRIGDAPANITGGSFAPDGEQFVLRNYVRAFLYTALDDPEPLTVRLPASPKGESVLLLESGDLLVGSEGAGSEVVRVRVPRDRTS